MAGSVRASVEPPRFRGPLRAANVAGSAAGAEESIAGAPRGSFLGLARAMALTEFLLLAIGVSHAGAASRSRRL